MILKEVLVFNNYKTFKYKIIFNMEILVIQYYHNKLIIKLFLDNNHKINYFKSFLNHKIFFIKI